jgi:gliding motility-associated-like protein
MKRLLLLKFTLLLLLLSSNIQAQFQNGLWTGKQAYNWYFYSKAGLSFNTSTPTALMDGEMFGDSWSEGSSTISDSEGSLLFYTNGMTIWNKQHEVMENGEGLLGDYTTTQSALIVPHPGNSNLYYVFAVAPLGGPNGLTYSIVDMELDNGKGAVTSTKNIQMESSISEKITAVHHSDGKQVWLITHKGNLYNPSNGFRAYKVSEEGIDLIPIISNVGQIEEFGTGQMKASPDGSKLALVSGVFGLFTSCNVYSFDNFSGIVSNNINLTSMVSESGYGVEFSPNNRFLYIVDQSSFLVTQLDLFAGDESAILASATFLTSVNTDENAVPEYGSLQVAPDGKIYMANHNTGGAISVIDYPNNAGVKCGFQLRSIDAKNTTYLGLPGFIQSYFESGILYEGECADAAVTFSTIRIPGIEMIEWNFGDIDSGAANTSTDITPSHTFANPGTYTVTATITSNGAQQITSTEVKIIVPDAVVPRQVPAACADNNGNAIFNLTQLSTGILNGQDATQFTLNYFATEEDLQANTPIATPASFTTLGQNIFAVVTNTQTGCKTSIQFNLPVNPMPQVAAPLLLEKCATPAGTAAFNLTQQDAAILNGQDAANFTVTYYSDADAQTPIATPRSFTSSGQTVYAVVSNNTTGCKSDIVSFNVTVTEASLFANALELTGCSPFNLGLVDAQLEEGLELTFYTSRADAENDTNDIADPQQFIIAGNEGIVYVRAKNGDGCVDVAELALHEGDCSIPRGISPNGDDKNDAFDLSGFNVAYLGIYNRFGQEVYSRSNYTSEWHGQSSNNNDLPTGTYYYMVKRGDGRSETGWVYVNREE